MTSQVAALSVGIVGDEAVCDLCYEEDCRAETDMNVIMTSNGGFIEVQGTAEGKELTKAELETLDDSEYNAKLTEVTQFLRRNKAVVDSYEPGSTFKIAVASMALEENVVSLNDHFYCGGSIKVADRRISCANRNGHGSQTFVQGVQNSCNPVFIEVGARVGREKFVDKILEVYNG